MAKKKDVQPEPKSIVPEETKVARAYARYIRVSPRKIRLVMNAVRRSPTIKAFRTLMTLRQKGARIVEKVLKSAVANAKVLGMQENRLYIADIRADDGPRMKRFMTRSMGRAEVMLKRMSHVSIILKEGAASGISHEEPFAEKQEAAPTSQKKKMGAKKAATKA